MRHLALFGLLASGLLVPVGAVGAAEKHPVYVGAEVCGSCHNGKGMGDQYSRFLLSNHARAYASLARPEAREIARLSGIPIEPRQAPACLGCHATAAEAEPWELDDTFHLEDGVQCEKCHGPGSEYMAPDVMMNGEAARRAGLRMPGKDHCAKCHYVKGSHVAVHHKPQLDLDEALRRIAHPTPDSPRFEMPKPREEVPPEPGPKYVGARACGSCHRGPMMGNQDSVWRMSAHARAWAVLGTAEAREMAAAQGVSGDPQESEACLSCHATGHGAKPGSRMASYSDREGVTCEACHGAGSEYVPEAVMRDPIAARAAGLLPAGPETCARCHQEAHGKPFDLDRAMEAIRHPKQLPKVAEEPRYKTPLNLAISPSGRELYVACEASSSVIVVDVARREKVAEIAVGGQPNDVTFSPDGSRAYVSNRLDDSVSVIDPRSREVVKTFPVGDEPHGVITDRTGGKLFVLNSSEDSISVIDTSTYTETRRLAASRSPWSLSRSPDGSRILVTNTLSRFVPARTPSISEITVIDAERGTVLLRVPVPETNLLQGVAWHPSGEFGFFTLNRTKNLVPMTRILQGWTITNGLGIVWRDGSLAQVLLDEPDLYFADTADVAFTPDGRLAFATSSGTDRVAVIDVAKLMGLVERATPRERELVLPNHLGKSVEFVPEHIPTRHSPRGVVVTPDGKTAFVANALDDTLTVIDVARLEAAGEVDLGGPREITQTRWGEQLFHSANIAFRRQFSCHSCHPDGHVDGLTYDIEPDGLGVDPVDNRTLRGILDTDPFKWSGKNVSIERQCGARLAVFFTRIDPFTPDQLKAVARYITTIPRPPNRYRPLGAELTPAQARGKELFYRSHDSSGDEIPADRRCSTCHFPPLYTSRTQVDVGTQMPLDNQHVFDVPHLNNIYDSAPYLHDGAAPTLEEIWTRFNPYDQHGQTNDMTKDELNDLVEYIKTL